MEAVPRLPMIGFELLTSTEKVSFGAKLKPYIASFYQEDPEGYNNEIHNLEGLRASAVWPSIDINSSQTMKKYYCQLHFLKSRFPMDEGQACAVNFSWKDNYTKMSCTIPDVNFELMCVLINIGSIHSKLGAEDLRTSPEGMKISCSHFQCAAWAFQVARENFGQFINSIMISSDQVRAMQLVSLAQAQECILEKSLLDNRKPTIIARIAVQLSDYYRQAVIAFQNGDEGLVLDHIMNHKYIYVYLQFKIHYHRCIALLYQGQQSEELQKMGERVAFYQAALGALEEARKQISDMPSAKRAPFQETLAFTLDVVEGKRKAATNENEFIYHEDVPNIETLQELKGASLVKGIPFNIHDLEVAGPDIFGRLVPMEAHEASSMYSEQKAQLLRQIGEKVEQKDLELNEFMSSMQFDSLSQMRQAKGLPQDLVDRAAAIMAKPNATKDLVDSMSKLSNTYHDVEAMLKETQFLINEENTAESEYQKIMGKRAPSIIATDLSREAAKYQEAHNKASESNQNLHKAMVTHVANLKVLAQPLNQLILQIPSLQLPDPNVDEQATENMEALLNKVDEMRNQRMGLWSQLRDAMHQDDITEAIVTREPSQSLDAVFQQGLDKHKKTNALIEQNLLAQENICKAIVEAYAKFTPTRKYLQDVLQKRNNTISALIASYDTYDDLLGKANKGIEFYAKLETNVSKLLQRVKSACKVQQEEREQILLKNGHTKHDVVGAASTSLDNSPIHQAQPQPTSNKPKLKDYLDSMKEAKAAVNENVLGPQMQYPMSSLHTKLQPDSKVWYDNAAAAAVAAQHNSVLDQTLADKMNALKVTTTQQYGNYANNYIYPVNYEALTTCVSSNPNQTNNTITATANYSIPPASYQTISNTNYPYVATSEQYNTNTTTDLSHKFNNGQTMAGAGVGAATITTTEASYMTYGGAGNYINATISATPTTTATTMSYNYNEMPSSYSSYPSTDNQYNYYQQHQTSSGTQIPPASNYSYPNASYMQQQQQQQQNYATPTNNLYSTPTISNNQGYSTNNYATGYNMTPTNQTYTTSSGYQDAAYNMGAQNAGISSQYADGGTALTTATTTTAATNLQYPVSNGMSASYYNNATAAQQYSSSNNVDINNSATQWNSYNANQYAAAAPATQSQPTVSSQDAAAAAAAAYYNTYYPMYNASGYNQVSSYQYPDVVQTQQNPTAQQQQQQQQPPTQQQQQSKKESSIDLLAGLDFSISQAPLIPQKEIIQENQSAASSKSAEVKDVKAETIIPQSTPKKSEVVVNKQNKLLQKGDPFKNPEIVKQFVQEVDKFEKYVEGLCVKTLSGPSTLDLKWKEIQECQENVDGAKRSISVARCYPLKNRSPDILPYDYSRVELTTTHDDYINASHIKDVNLYCMDFIVTQAPLTGTTNEFWTMIWEQGIENVVCLLSDNELREEIYWPTDVGKEIAIGNKLISVLSASNDECWVIRRLNIAFSDRKESRVITMFQYTTWPGSLFPTNPLPFINFLKRIIVHFEQQKYTGVPVLVHCLAGVGRSGICCILLAALMELAATAYPLSDIPNLACKMSCCRKNILRDREHLKFVYTAFLAHLQTMKKMFVKSSDNEKKAEEVPVEKVPVDPLSALDPLWATRKS